MSEIARWGVVTVAFTCTVPFSAVVSFYVVALAVGA